MITKNNTRIMRDHFTLGIKNLMCVRIHNNDIIRPHIVLADSKRFEYLDLIVMATRKISNKFSHCTFCDYQCEARAK